MDIVKYLTDKYHLDLSKRRVFIPDMGRDELAHIFTLANFRVGVEIGTEKGKYARILLKNPELKLFCVDPYRYYDSGQGYIPISQKKHFKHYIETFKRLSGYNLVILTEFSDDALDRFEDNSLDFVYIDGNHRLDYVVSDIVKWSVKVRVGGVIAGHDYIKLKGQCYNHIPYALEAYAGAYQLKNYFVLDNKKNDGSLEDAFKDRIRSWFFIKR